MYLKKLHFKKIITLIILLTSIYIYPGCQKNVDNVKIDPTNPNDVNKITFKKQGEVVFKDKNKNLVKKIDVEIAETDETRHLGLMYREKMEDTQGMLFIFPAEEPEGFYMRNTVIPLDIIFVNSKKEIVKIFRNTTPFSEK